MLGHRTDVMAVLDAADVLVHPLGGRRLPDRGDRGDGRRPAGRGHARGGIPEIVADGETGALVPAPATAAELPAALEPLVTDAELSARMGAAGRARYERYFTVGDWAGAPGRCTTRSSTRAARVSDALVLCYHGVSEDWPADFSDQPRPAGRPGALVPLARLPALRRSPARRRRRTAGARARGHVRRRVRSPSAGSRAAADRAGRSGDRVRADALRGRPGATRVGGNGRWAAHAGRPS